MKHTIWLLFATLFLFTAAHANAAGEQVWVSSKGVKLKAQRKSSSQTIAELKPGLKLNVIKYEKRWYNVTAPGGKTGWVYRGRVSKEKPEIEEEKSDDDGSIGSLFGDSSGSSIKADSASSSRSIRGLSPEAEEYARQSGSPKECRDALDSVLAQKTESRDVETFLRQGKIGEYAE